MSNPNKTVRTLRHLRSMQANLGRQLERAYLRDRMSDYLAMEKRQRNIAVLIDKLWGQLDEKSRSHLRQTQSRSLF